MNPHSPLTFQDPITVGYQEPTRAHDSSSQSDASDQTQPTNHGSSSSPIGGDNSKQATEAENKRYIFNIDSNIYDFHKNAFPCTFCKDSKSIILNVAKTISE